MQPPAAANSQQPQQPWCWLCQASHHTIVRPGTTCYRAASTRSIEDLIEGAIAAGVVQPTPLREAVKTATHIRRRSRQP